MTRLIHTANFSMSSMPKLKQFNSMTKVNMKSRPPLKRWQYILKMSWLLSRVVFYPSVLNKKVLRTS